MSPCPATGRLRPQSEVFGIPWGSSCRAGRIRVTRLVFAFRKACSRPLSSRRIGPNVWPGVAASIDSRPCLGSWREYYRGGREVDVSVPSGRRTRFAHRYFKATS